MSIPIRAIRYLVNLISDCCSAMRDSLWSSYTWEPNCANQKLYRMIHCRFENLSVPAKVIELFKIHRFDIFGSGWTDVRYGKKCRGLGGYRYRAAMDKETDAQGVWLEKIINRSNFRQAQKIWRLIDPDYQPIDWHLDFKSGYRWKARTWYKFAKKGHLPGVDIKVPWELSRCQHLTQMALAYCTENHPNFRDDSLRCEFRNQILDFIAVNPPRYGVNWKNSMEVAIRAANWLLAFDLFSNGRADFDESFNAIFTASLYMHGMHIWTNLEWYHHRRGNHYLANIAGLAFIAAYLPSNRKTNAWLSFAIHELISEAEHQFHHDGTHFESSIAYHRFSAEIIFFATALVLGIPHERLEKIKSCNAVAIRAGLPKNGIKLRPWALHVLPRHSKPQTSESPFPDWYLERMERMTQFVVDITKPNGNIPQIGDNDNGHLFKLDPNYLRTTVKEAKERYVDLEGYSEMPDDSEYFHESHLDCGQLVSAGLALFKRPDFSSWLQQYGLTNNTEIIVCELARQTVIGTQRIKPDRIVDDVPISIGHRPEFDEYLTKLTSLPESHVRIYDFPVSQNNRQQDVVLFEYPDFGLYIHKSARIYLAIRCVTNLKGLRTGHMHHDQLSLELMINGKEIIVDPGSYIYTPLPEERIKYRNGSSHFTPVRHLAPHSMPDKKLFGPIQIAEARVIFWGKDGFLAILKGTDYDIGLLVKIGGESIRVYHINTETALVDDYFSRNIHVSPGYGLKGLKTLCRKKEFIDG